VLRDIGFAVEPGRSVALVGATGAGKTSIISLLMRFYDVQKGRVVVDGVDVREWDAGRLRSALALVLQDVHLFSGTIASNIRLGSTIRWSGSAPRPRPSTPTASSSSCRWGTRPR